QLAEALQTRAYHTIENDYQRIFTSVNAGRPLTLDDPDAPAARDIVALAGKLINRQAPGASPPPRKGFFGRMAHR
ncbi:MAG TPA: hypothetical protein VN972_00980, partial [Methylomirabilota bacterium]|nr:hypothetical protein [Methylomirabilota bacterium]